MKRLITLLALGAAIGLRAAAQEPAKTVVIERESRLTAAQAERLNKQITEARKQIDEAQAQLTAMQNAAAVQPPAQFAPVAPMAPVAPTPPVPPVAPEPPVKSDAISRLGGSYTVGESEVVEGDARAVGGSLTVDGVVKGDASVAGGTLRINGTVEGDASTTGGSMYLGPDAIVRGNVRCIGGSLHREDGSQINGSLRVTGGSRPGEMKPDTEEALTGTAFPLPLAIVFLLAGMVFLTAAPKRIDTIGRAFVNQPMYSLLIGIAAIPLSIILLVVSAITVVGPLMVSFGMLGAFLMGVTAVALMLGRRVAMGKTYRSRFYPLVVGLVVWFLASAVSRIVGPLFALMCVVTGVAYMMALGAAIGTGFGKQSGWLKNRMDGNRAGTPWIDPSYTYAGTQDAYKDIA